MSSTTNKSNNQLSALSAASSSSTSSKKNVVSSPTAEQFVSPETHQQQLQQQQQEHNDWKNLVSSSLKTNLDADSKQEQQTANELPSPIAPNHKKTDNTSTALFPPIVNSSNKTNLSSNNYSNGPVAQQVHQQSEAPWTRWQVEARLNDRLYPVEKRMREDRKLVEEEKHRFAMHLPRSPQVFFSPPTSSQFSQAQEIQQQQNQQQQASASARNTQQQQSTWESENFNLRERVHSLEEQLQFFRNQIDNHLNVRTTAKRRRHIQYLSAVMDAQAKRRVALRLFGKWVRFAKQKRMDSRVKDARDSAGKEIMETSLQRELIQQEMDVVRKHLLEERDKNKIIMKEREELLIIQQELGKQVEELEQEIKNNNKNNIIQNNFVSPSPPNARNNNNNNKSATKIASENNIVFSSPYNKVNQNLYQQSVTRTKAAANSSPTLKSADNDNKENNDADLFQQERQVFEQRIEQLSLRCMDQDEVIRTLFVELAAVGKELQTQQQLYEKKLPEFFTTAEAASMLLRQSVDPNVEAKMVESVTSPWPRLRTNNNNSNFNNNLTDADIGSVRRSNQQSNNTQSLNPINAARLLDSEYNERMRIVEEQANRNNSNKNKNNREGSPFEL